MKEKLVRLNNNKSIKVIEVPNESYMNNYENYLKKYDSYVIQDLNNIKNTNNMLVVFIIETKMYVVITAHTFQEEEKIIDFTKMD